MAARPAMAVPPAKGLDEACAWLHKAALTPFPLVTKLSRTTVTERTRLGRELNFFLSVIAHRLIIGSVHCLCASCICILYSIYDPPPTLILPAYFYFSLYAHPYVLSLSKDYLIGGLSIWRAISIWRAPSFFLPPCSFLSFFYGLDHPDTSIPAASKITQLIFRDQDYVSSNIHFVCVYTPCLYT